MALAFKRSVDVNNMAMVNTKENLFLFVLQRANNSEEQQKVELIDEHKKMSRNYTQIRKGPPFFLTVQLAFVPSCSTISSF